MACAPRTEVRRDSRPGIPVGRCAAGRGGGDDGADKRAIPVSEGAGAGRWAGVRDRERSGSAGRTGPRGAGQAGERAGQVARARGKAVGKSGPRGERAVAGFGWAEWGAGVGPAWDSAGPGTWVGFELLGWFSFSNFNSISYFYFKQSLNSNKNLKSNHTQTIKTMHQHECNTKIKPMINFNHLRNKIRLNAN